MEKPISIIDNINGEIRRHGMSKEMQLEMFTMRTSRISKEWREKYGMN